MKYSLLDYLNNECSREQFVGQYNPIKLEIGKTYRQQSASWSEKHYKIVAIDGNIAMAVSVYSQISNGFIGDYDLFYVNSGFKYQDIQRPEYRLIEEVGL